MSLFTFVHRLLLKIVSSAVGSLRFRGAPDVDVRASSFVNNVLGVVLFKLFTRRPSRLLRWGGRKVHRQAERLLDGASSSALH